MALFSSLDRGGAPVNERIASTDLDGWLNAALVVVGTVLPIAWAMELLARWSADLPLMAAVAGLRVAATTLLLVLLVVAMVRIGERSDPSSR